MPRWFRALFVALMLGACVVLAWCTADMQSVRIQLDDTTLMLETSRQRERKQQYEYDQASAQLPEVLAALESAQPITDAALAEEAALRAERKQLRADVKAVEGQLAALRAELTAALSSLETLAREYGALTADLSELIDQASALIPAQP